VSGDSWTGTVTLAGNGANSIVAEDTDAAGNVGTSSPVTFNLTITAGGWGNPTGGSWNTAANWSTGSVPGSTSNVIFAPVGATVPYVVSILPATTVTVSSITLDDPNVTLLDEGTLAIAASLVETSGNLEIANGGSLSLGGGSSLLLDFIGSGGSLTLGSSPGFTGTVDAVSTATGAVSISGGGSVTTTSGDAIDLEGSGGTPTSSAELSVSLNGPIAGADKGISVIQDGYGAIAIVTNGPVAGQAGAGIFAEDLNTSDSSNVAVTADGNVTGSTNGVYALTDGSGSVTATAGANVSIVGPSTAIQVISNGVGNLSVTTATGDVITSINSDGINVYNQATAIPAADASTITVTAYGTIDSGSMLNGSGSQPAGILAGYRGGTANTVNSSVFGSVTINSYANITAAGGDGIRGYNYGIGNITITDEANTTIVAPVEFGIREVNYGSGNDSVTTSSGDSITSGASGISAINEATAIASSAGTTINVVAHGSIDSGTNLNPSGSQPQGISAGYYGSNGTTNNAINGTVSVENFANISAAAGWAIDAFNYGNGAVTLTEETGTTVSGAQYGIGAYSLGSNSGGLTVNVSGNATITAGALYGLWGIQADTNNASNVSVTTSSGDVINSGGTGINANNAATSASSSSLISITAYGTIDSGFDMNSGGGEPGGIWAGYNNGGTSTFSSAIDGSVSIDSFATISAAAGAGVGIYNFGVGNVTLTLESTSEISAPLQGVTAFAQGGGDVTITNDGTITSANGDGIAAGTGTSLTVAGNGIVSITNAGTKNSQGNFTGGIITALGSQNFAVVQINNDSTQSATFANSGSVVATLYNDGSNFSAAVSNYNGSVAGNNGAITINNSGIISGNVNLGSASTTSAFDNQTGGVWNTNGQNYFSGTATITNAGIINIFGDSSLSSSESLTVNNTGAIDVEANSSAAIAGAVTGAGSFLIGNVSKLEFTSSVAGGTVTFTGLGLLTLDDPAGFSATIAGLSAGDLIDLDNIEVSSASISASTLSITETGGQTLSYTVSGVETQSPSVDILYSSSQGSEIVLAPTTQTSVSSSTTPVTLSPGSASAFYLLSGAAISESTGVGLTISSSDSNSADTVATALNASSSIAVTGAFNGLDVTTVRANISVINDGSISSTAGIGLMTSTASGGTAIADFGNVSGTIGIEAVASEATVTTNAATPTSSSTLSFASIPSWIVAGLTAYDATTNKIIGTVSATTATSITLTANAANAVGSGDVLSFYTTAAASAPTSTASPTLDFGSTLSGIVAGMTVYDLTTGNFIGAVSSTTSTTVTLTANAADAVASGDTLAFEATESIAVAQDSIITASSSRGISATTTLESVTVMTGGNVTINAAGAGIVVQNQGTSVPLANNSSLTVNAAGTINSGNVTGSYPAGISIGYLGGTSAPSGSPNPPLSGIFGDVTVDSTATITANTGVGITAYTYGTGDVTVSNSGSITATGAENTNGSGDPTTAQYGIVASNYGDGDVTVVDVSVLNASGAETAITAGSAGIFAFNDAMGAQATPVGSEAAPVTVSVVATGTITSGIYLMNGGNAPAGIVATVDPGGTSGYNAFVYGDVVVDAGGTIDAQAGDGIRAGNHGQGNVTVNLGYNASITAQNTPTGASSNLAPYGVGAFAYGPGDIEVTTLSGDTITSGSAGIDAVNQATAIPTTANALVTVNTAGAINSGTVQTDNASPPSGIYAGFLGGTSLVQNLNVNGNVIVNNAATITVAAGRGIVGYNYGNGDVTVNDSGNVTVSGNAVTASSTATTTTQASEYGIEAFADGGGTGNVALNVYSGAIIQATSTSAPITTPIYGVYASSADNGNISVITDSGSSITSSGVGIDAVNDGSQNATQVVTTNGATSTSSPTLSFAATPSWIVYGMPVYDVTTGKLIGTVSSTTGTTVTLAANAANAVGSGDQLSFSALALTNAATSTSSAVLNFASAPSWVVAGMPVYDVTTGETIGTVSAITGTTITLTANAASAVGSGDALSFPDTATTSSATPTSSPTLTFALSPSWVVAGMTAYDVTTGSIIGTVASTTATTVTLTANAANAVASGDTLSFAASSIVVTSSSTISSGTVVTGTGSPPGGIIAGYLGGDLIPTTFPLAGLDGDVTVNNFGNITAAAGDGIRAYTYGIGNVTVNEGAGTITALGGSSPTNGFGDGINASNRGPGDILVTTAAGTAIDSGSSGISAINYAPSTGSSFTVPASSQVTVVAYGTITSGNIPTLSNSPINEVPAGILAGYDPGVSTTNPNDEVNGNVAGNVLINDYATITAAAGTDGIRGINYGTGSVTIIAESGATITGGRYGIGGFAFDGGNVNVTNYATVTGATAAIDTQATGSGTVTINNYGTIDGAVISSGTTTLTNEAGATWTAAGSSIVSTLSNAGTIILDAGSSLTVTGNVVTAPAPSSSTTVESFSFQVSGGTFTVDGTFMPSGGDVTASDGGQVQLAGLSDTNLGYGLLDVTDANSSIEIGTAGGAAGGSITVDSGVTITTSGSFAANSIVDKGAIIVAASGSLTLSGALSGSGQIDIGTQANLTVEGGSSGAPSPAPSIAFEGANGTLTLSSAALDSSLNFDPVISGFGTSDAIIFNGTVTSASYSGGVLTLLDGTTAVAHLTLSGSYQGDTFYAVSTYAITTGSAGTQIGISAGGDTATAPAGTTTADNYAWAGAVEGSWDQAANWNDTTASQSPASVAPGSNDNVTINSSFNGEPYEGAVVVTGIGNSASLLINGSVILAGQFTTGQLVMGSTTTLGDLSLSTGASLLVTGSATGNPIEASYNVEGGTLTVDGAFNATYAEITVANGGHVQLAGSTSVSDFGTVSVDSTSSFEIGTTGGAAAGSLTVDAGVSATLSGSITATSIVDNGTILFSAESVSALYGTLAGTGQIDIGSNSSLSVYGQGAASLSMAFEGSGTLTLSSADLNSTLTFAPTITGLDATDKIDFSGATVTNAFWNSGVLTLEDGTTPVAYLNLSGNYATDSFTVTTVNGVSQIVDPPGTAQTIADGAQLELNTQTAEKVTFEGSTGTLVLDQPTSFQGQIAGLSGPGDVLTLQGFDAAHTTVDAQYNPLNDTTLLEVTDASDHQSASLILDGNYGSTIFKVTADPNGGVDISGSPATATVAAGGTLELNHASSEQITFLAGTGSLVIDQPSTFTGAIAGFTGTAPDPAHSDTIDVVGINYDSPAFQESYDAQTGVLSLTDGLQDATFKFDDFNATLDFASDNHGGTLITDPPAPTAPAEVTAVANGDQFIFRGSNASANEETVDHFAPGESKNGLGVVAFNGIDVGSFNAWHSSEATPSGKDLPIKLGPEGQHPHEDILLKNVALASLHANDFILPSH
jgi:large repetitive protein